MATFTGDAGDNVLNGGAEIDTLTGLDGADTLDGGAGADTLAGGTGNDLYIVDLLATSATTVALEDTITELSGEGTDTLKLRTNGVLSLSSAATVVLAADLENLDASATTTNLLNLTGNASDNTLTGNSADNTLTGGDGNDTLDGRFGRNSSDILVGGLGNDTYVVNSISDVVTEASGQGTDLVQVLIGTGSYTLGADVENGQIISAASVGLIGNSANNTLTGNAASNTLDGGTGADSLIGGDGNDTYIVDNAGDSVTEGLNKGFDTIKSSITFDLAASGANVEYLTLTGTSSINGSGNALDNIIRGNSNDNALNGAAGKDTLYGARGDDTYSVNLVDLVAGTSVELEDKVKEFDDQGSGEIDTLVLSFSGTAISAAQTLVLDKNLEALDASGTGTLKLNLTGNSEANILTGNDFGNIIDGKFGNDTMIGGLGNDTYKVNSTGDVVTEASGEGTDLVEVKIATAGGTYTLLSNVENATLTSSVAFNLTGNGDANILTGNAAANTLDGGAGIDTLLGLGGDDTYLVDNASDVVDETGGGGTDLIKSSVTYDLSNGSFVIGTVENLTLTGSSAINGTGNASDNMLTGNSGNNTLTGNNGNDTLDGGAGNDTLVGGAGNDTYVVDSASDVVTEAASGGTDLVQSSVNWTLGTEVENLTLTGSAATATGNTLANTIVGNDSANTLSGKEANDTLTGGAGADIFGFQVLTSAGVDSITDFSLDDQLAFTTTGAFTGLTFASGTSGALLSSSAQFSSGTVATASTAAERLIYDTDDGKLYYDSDGTGATAAVQIATLTYGATVPALFWTDIQLF